MIIDAHAHACGAFLKGKNIIEILNKNNVDKVVLVPGELGSDKNCFFPDLAPKFPNMDVVSFTNLLTKIVIMLSTAAKQIDEGNNHVFLLAKNYPERIFQFYWVMLSQPNALDKLECHYAKYRFKGIKLHQCWESFKIESKSFHEVAEWATSKELPLFVHLFSKNQASQLSEYIKAHPNTTFIIAHLFGLERYIKAGINSNNVFFETSTPQLVSINRLKKAINHFGANRILLGSDIPYDQNNLQLNIDRITNLNIKSEDKKLMLGENMKRLLKIQN